MRVWTVIARQKPYSQTSWLSQQYPKLGVMNSLLMASSWVIFWVWLVPCRVAPFLVSHTTYPTAIPISSVDPTISAVECPVPLQSLIDHTSHPAPTVYSTNQQVSEGDSVFPDPMEWIPWTTWWFLIWFRSDIGQPVLSLRKVEPRLRSSFLDPQSPSWPSTRIICFSTQSTRSCSWTNGLPFRLHHSKICIFRVSRFLRDSRRVMMTSARLRLWLLELQAYQHLTWFAISSVSSTFPQLWRCPFSIALFSAGRDIVVVGGYLTSTGRWVS